VKRYFYFLFVFFAANSVSSASWASGKLYIASDQLRAMSGDRIVDVIVPQAEISVEAPPQVYAGGGILGAVIASSIQSSREKNGEARILPLRNALTGFDVDGLALDATKAAVANVPWLHAKSVAFGKDSSLVGESTLLDTNGTDQTMFVTYSYSLEPSCATLKISATVAIANKAAIADEKPVKRLSADNLAYSQTITYTVSLNTPSKQREENVAQWSSDNGKFARKALTAGFEALKTLLPKALSTPESDAKSVKHVVFDGQVLNP